jgi:serine/threonine protein kinase
MPCDEADIEPPHSDRPDALVNALYLHGFQFATDPDTEADTHRRVSLGAGTFGTVFGAAPLTTITTRQRHRHGGCTFVVKCVSLAEAEVGYEEERNNRILTASVNVQRIRRMRHVVIATAMFTVAAPSNTLVIVMPKLSHSIASDLRRIRDTRHTPVSSPQPLIHLTRVVLLLTGMVRGARALHLAGLVHSDITLSNVMVNHRGDSVLIDMGCAHLIGEGVRSGACLWLPECGGTYHSTIGEIPRPATTNMDAYMIVHWVLALGLLPPTTTTAGAARQCWSIGSSTIPRLVRALCATQPAVPTVKLPRMSLKHLERILHRVPVHGEEWVAGPAALPESNITAILEQLEHWVDTRGGGGVSPPPSP